MTVERELREAVAALRRARDTLNSAEFVIAREAIGHEIARAETSAGRALHLIAGPLPSEVDPHAA